MHIYIHTCTSHAPRLAWNIRYTGDIERSVRRPFDLHWTERCTVWGHAQGGIRVSHPPHITIFYFLFLWIFKQNLRIVHLWLLVYVFIPLPPSHMKLLSTLYWWYSRVIIFLIQIQSIVCSHKIIILRSFELLNRIPFKPFAT